MSCRRRTTLYIGVTSDLERRIAEHRTHTLPGFTRDYNLEILVYFEHFPSIRDAIDRETQLKKWSRSKKDALIAKLNPELLDLSLTIFQ
jgi:putative endonuclease